MGSSIQTNTLINALGDGPTKLFGQSAAKAWATIEAVATPTVENGFNLTSLLDVSTGKYDISFNNPMKGLWAVGACNRVGFRATIVLNRTEEGFQICNYNSSASFADGSPDVAIYGEVA